MAEQVEWYLLIQGYDADEPDPEEARHSGLEKIPLRTESKAAALVEAQRVWRERVAHGRRQAPDGLVYPRSPRLIQVIELGWDEAPAEQEDVNLGTVVHDGLLQVRYDRRGQWSEMTRHILTPNASIRDACEKIVLTLYPYQCRLVIIRPGRMGTFTTYEKALGMISSPLLRPATLLELITLAAALRDELGQRFPNSELFALGTKINLVDGIPTYPALTWVHGKLVSLTSHQFMFMTDPFLLAVRK